MPFQQIFPPFQQNETAFYQTLCKRLFIRSLQRMIFPSFQCGEMRIECLSFAVSAYYHQGLITLLNRSAKVISFSFLPIREKEKFKSEIKKSQAAQIPEL